MSFIKNIFNKSASTNNTSKEENIMTNIEKAIALITTFVSGDTAKAESLLAEGYIQHNLAFGTGRSAFVAAVKGLATAPVKTTVRNIRAFEDGDKVFLQTVYNFAGAGEQVAFDVFRFENGLIAEHWDNLDSVAAPNPSGHTQIDGATEIKDLDKTEANRKLVLGFVEDVLMGKNMAALASYYDGNNYIQHNTGIADGLDGLGAALAAMAEQGIAMVYDETHIAVAQGNFVLTGSQGSFGGKAVTFYDLFRVENDKIAEHWDVIEPLADKATWANENGKFGNEAILTKEDKNMKIAVVAANGRVGQLVVKEALSRGLDVTAIVRGENKSEAKKVIAKEALSLSCEDLTGFDVVVSAVGGWTAETVGAIPAATKHLIETLSGTKTRLVVVGGAGSLFVNPEHTLTVSDGPDFPEAWMPIANAHGEALQALRDSKELAWTYISPAADFQADAPRTGEYKLAGEEFTLSSKGESTISYADYAIAMVDEIVSAAHVNERISVVNK